MLKDVGAFSTLGVKFKNEVKNNQTPWLKMTKNTLGA